MTLTYIFHSSFALDTGTCILLFDYWMDPAAVVPRLLAADKPLYVFSSHFHEDHFNRETISTGKFSRGKRDGRPTLFIFSRKISGSTAGHGVRRLTSGWPKEAVGRTITCA